MGRRLADSCRIITSQLAKVPCRTHVGLKPFRRLLRDPQNDSSLSLLQPIQLFEVRTTFAGQASKLFDRLPRLPKVLRVERRLRLCARACAPKVHLLPDLRHLGDTDSARQVEPLSKPGFSFASAFLDDVRIVGAGSDRVLD